MKIRRKIESYKEQIDIENEPHIKFRRKKTKSNIKRGFRFIISCLIYISIVVVFSDIVARHRVNKKIEELNYNKINEDYVILDYNKIVNEISESIVSISDSKDSIENIQSANNVSGVIINNEGIILTSYSSVKNNEEIYIKLQGKNKEPIKAVIVATDEKYDIALIKINYNGEIKAAKVAKSVGVSEGQGIALLSNSYGNRNSSIYPGIISSINDKVDLMEISGGISSKDMGGVVCNSKGELIAIVTNEINNKRQIGSMTYYAVNLTSFTEILEQSEQFNQVLGIQGGLVVKDKKGTTQGYYIERLEKNGPAQKAGLKATDIIYSLDGVMIFQIEDISNILSNKKPGDTINCKVIRNENIEEVKLIIEEKK